MFGRLAVVTAVATMSAALLGGVASASEDGDEDYYGPSDATSGTPHVPSAEYGYGYNSFDETDEDYLRDPEDNKGGRGGEPGTNSADCDMSLNSGDSCGTSRPPHRGADGPDRLVF